MADRKRRLKHHRQKRSHCWWENCEISFDKFDKLRKHISDVHLKLRAYHCTWPQCGQKHGRRNNLNMHIRTVHFKGQTGNDQVDQRDTAEFVKVCQKTKLREQEYFKNVRRKNMNIQMRKTDDQSQQPQLLSNSSPSTSQAQGEIFSMSSQFKPTETLYPYTCVKTLSGRPKIIFEGASYFFKATLQNDKKRFICSKVSSKNCKAALHMENDKIVKFLGTHNHLLNNEEVVSDQALLNQNFFPAELPKETLGYQIEKSKYGNDIIVLQGQKYYRQYRSQSDCNLTLYYCNKYGSTRCKVRFVLDNGKITKLVGDHNHPLNNSTEIVSEHQSKEETNEEVLNFFENTLSSSNLARQDNHCLIMCDANDCTACFVSMDQLQEHERLEHNGVDEKNQVNNTFISSTTSIEQISALYDNFESDDDSIAVNAVTTINQTVSSLLTFDTCICDLTGFTPEETEVHKVLHRSLAPFHCEWPNCTAPSTFAWIDQMKHVCLSHLRAPVIKDDPNQAKYVSVARFVRADFRDQFNSDWFINSWANESERMALSIELNHKQQSLEVCARTKQVMAPLPYVCKYRGCRYSFKFCTDLTTHIELCHVRFASSLVLGQCDATTNWSGHRQRYLDTLNLAHLVNHVNHVIGRTKAPASSTALSAKLAFPLLSFYSCHQCEKTFSSLDILRAHIRSHLGHKPFVCKLCSFAHHSQSVTRKHLQNVHNMHDQESQSLFEHIIIRPELLDDDLIYESLCLSFTGGKSSQFIYSSLDVN